MIGAERRLRVLVLSNLFPPAVSGGYELECAGVVARLRRDHDVLVLTSKRGRGQGGDPGVARLLPFLPHRRVTRVFAALHAVRAARSARRVLEDFRPEVVYIWNGAQIPQVVVRLLETSGVPVLYRVCEHWFGRLYDSDAFMRGLRGGPYSAPMRAVNLLPSLQIEATTPVPAAISWNSETLRNLTPTPATVAPILERTILPATDQAEAFIGLERRPSPEPTIGFVGRIAQEKGIEVALRALAVLRDRHGITPHFRLAGAGTARYRRRLEALAEELGVDAQMHLLGTLDTDGLRDLLASVHVVVVPSVWEEPAGLVLAESALARVPVVASRVGGIPEILEDGEHALLCPPGDPDPLADALARTLSGLEDTEARVARAFGRAQRLRVGHYHEAMDEFFSSSLSAFASQRP